MFSIVGQVFWRLVVVANTKDSDWTQWNPARGHVALGVPMTCDDSRVTNVNESPVTTELLAGRFQLKDNFSKYLAFLKTGEVTDVYTGLYFLSIWYILPVCSSTYHKFHKRNHSFYYMGLAFGTEYSKVVGVTSNRVIIVILSTLGLITDPGKRNYCKRQWTNTIALKKIYIKNICFHFHFVLWHSMCI